MADNIDKRINGASENLEDLQIAPEMVEMPEADLLENALIQMQEDGSAILGAEMDSGEEVPFDANLSEYIDDSELMGVASGLIAGIEEDKSSRKDWEETYSNGIKLLGFKNEERSQPFEGSSGVHHPLLAESITQFQAQAYKELLPASGPVKTQVLGVATGENTAQAERVKEFMNYQIMHVMEEYDPELDQLLFYLPLSGSAFKKVYYNQTMERAVSNFVAAEDLLVPYTATDLLTCSRITHIVRMLDNELKKLQASGFYRDIEINPEVNTSSGLEVQSAIDEAQGVEPTGVSDQEYGLYEVHTDLDLPGFEDVDQSGEMTGIKLPYIVTIDEDSTKILAIRRNWAQTDPRRMKIQYFVHYKFLPGLGFYGFGLTHMIGGLTQSSTSILRQLIDAGTLANLPAGFKARGIRVRNEDEPLQPGEFRDVDAPGGSLRDALMPLPFKEPSATLLNLLGILVDSGRRFASIADMKVADSNQAMPVGTTVAMLERGTKVMSAIHKRLHYAQKVEFNILARVFAQYLPPEYPYQTIGGQQQIKAMDFDDRVDIVPVSDPNIFSMSQRIMMAQTQLQLVQSNPEVHGPQGMYQAYKRMYEALGVQDIDSILSPPQEPEPSDPATDAQNILKGQSVQAFPGQDHDAYIQTYMSVLQTMPAQSNMAIYSTLVSQMYQHVSLKVKAAIEQQMQPQIQQILMQSGGNMTPEMQTNIKNMIDNAASPIIAQEITKINQNIAPPQQEDPLVTLRRQELAIKGADIERKSREFDSKQGVEVEKIRSGEQISREKIGSQEQIADDKIDVALEKLDQQADFKESDIRRGK